MTLSDLLLASLCAYRVTRFVTRDSLTARLRERLEPLVDLRDPVYDPRRRHVAMSYGAELLLCSWCLSVHVSLLVVGALTLWPDSTPLTFAVRVLAVAALAGLLLDRDRS